MYPKRLRALSLCVYLLLLSPLYCFGQVRDQFFDSAGTRIRYIVAGTGEPVILIHGFSASAEMWTPLIQELSPHYQVIAMDCRGHGTSGKPHDPAQYGIEMVNDVVRLMDHLHLAKAHIVGYSMGGSILMKMLIDQPDRFLTAVIGGSTGFRSTDKEETPDLVRNLQSGMSFSEAMIASAPPGTPAPSPQQRQMMARMDAGQDPRALAAQRLGNPGLFVEYALLAHNSVPTLVIYGEFDNPSRFDELKRALPNSEFKIIEKAGHGAAVQSPQFAAYVRDFLDRHSLQRRDH